MSAPFLLVRLHIGTRTSLVEVTCTGDAFRVASKAGVTTYRAEDVVEALVAPVTAAPRTSDVDVIVVGCRDEAATIHVLASRRGDRWCDVIVDDEGIDLDWFDVRSEVVAALVGLAEHAGDDTTDSTPDDTTTERAA